LSPPVGGLVTNVGPNPASAQATLSVSPLGAISGRIFRDSNNDGIAQPADSGIAGQTVDNNTSWGNRGKNFYLSHGANTNAHVIRNNLSIAGGTGDNLLGTCGGASHGPGPRTALGNWATQITELTP